MKLEKEFGRREKGKIDVFARKGNYSIGIHIDDSQIRKKSIDKLNAFKPIWRFFYYKITER